LRSLNTSQIPGATLATIGADASGGYFMYLENRDEFDAVVCAFLSDLG